jgi:hypothetical protein
MKTAIPGQPWIKSSVIPEIAFLGTLRGNRSDAAGEMEEFARTAEKAADVVEPI